MLLKAVKQNNRGKAEAIANRYTFLNMVIFNRKSLNRCVRMY